MGASKPKGLNRITKIVICAWKDKDTYFYICLCTFFSTAIFVTVLIFIGYKIFLKLNVARLCALYLISMFL